LVNNPNTTHFRLALRSETEAKFPLSAFAEKNIELGTVGGLPQDRDLELEQLSLVTDVPITEINEQGQILSEHIIQATTAHKGITDWNTLLNSNDPLKDFTSYNGLNIQYFIIEKEVVAKVITEEQTANIVLTFALNHENKLTPILMNTDYIGTVSKTSARRKHLYDLTAPVPPF
tara:strand:- start:1231 stop:1755 length:525 start_codon:yes stop_codon:yes gene_type:complete